MKDRHLNQTMTMNIYYSDFEVFYGLKARLNALLRGEAIRVTAVASQFVEASGPDPILDLLYNPNPERYAGRTEKE